MHDKELNALNDLIQFQIRNHQNMTAQDIYKLLYQGAMGPKHLLNNPEAAKQYLKQEWDSVEPDREELFFEPVSPNGNVFRVNIRPCKYVISNYLILWEVLYQSAFEFKEDHVLFKKTWQDFYQLVLDNRLPFSIKKIEELDRQSKKNDYPAIHHSREYNITNKPAYRVLIKEELEKLINLTNPVIQ